MTPADLLRLRDVRSALFMPGSNPRAIAKAQTLACDMVILDLEDAVPADQKDAAREGAAAAAVAGFGGRPFAIRLNAIGTPEHLDDCAAVGRSLAPLAVLPKVESAAEIDALPPELHQPVIAMIETPLGLYNAREIAARPRVAGLMAGVNDLAASIGVTPGAGRSGLELALQTIVLAAAAASKPAFDGVYNKLDDLSGLDDECAQGRAWGFTGKSLIHPGHVQAANRGFEPSEKQLAAAAALVAAASGGAERYKGEMIEAMHVEAARAMLARTGRAP